MNERDRNDLQRLRQEMYEAILGLLEHGAIDSVTDLGETRFARLCAVLSDDQLRTLLDRTPREAPRAKGLEA